MWGCSMPLKKRVIETIDENKFLIDLESIPDKTISVQDYAEVMMRNKLYLRYKTQSKIREDAWASFLCISPDRDRAYCTGITPVPNVIMNRAYKVCKRMKTVRVNFIKEFNK